MSRPSRPILRLAPVSQAFRFNNRKMTDAGRFSLAVSGIVGKRMTLDELTDKDQAERRLGQPQA
jgi:hypothetical protein